MLRSVERDCNYCQIWNEHQIFLDVLPWKLLFLFELVFSLLPDILINLQSTHMSFDKRYNLSNYWLKSIVILILLKNVLNRKFLNCFSHLGLNFLLIGNYAMKFLFEKIVQIFKGEIF